MWFRWLSVSLEYLYWQITDTGKPLGSRVVNLMVNIVKDNTIKTLVLF